MLSAVIRVSRPSSSQLRLHFPFWTNLAFILVAAAALVPVLQSGQFVAVPLVLATLSGVGALYRESWQFDRLAGEAVRTNGFIPAQRRTVINIAEIETILYEQFKLGATTTMTSGPDLPDGGQRRFLRSQVHARLAIVMSGESEPSIVNIRTARGPGCARLLDLAEILERFLEVPLRLKS